LATGQHRLAINRLPDRSFRVRLIRTFLLGVALVVAQAAAVAAEAPSCRGKDMLEEMKVTDPALHARIMATSEATPNANALLWKIERAGTPVSYLFGTMHLTDDRINTLPPAVEAAVKGARRLILEVGDLSGATFAKAFAKARELILFTDGRRLEQLLSEAEYARLARLLQRSGFPSEMAGAFRPWVATLLLALSNCERRRVSEGLLPLDMRLARDARARGVGVTGLESLDQQFRAMAEVPEADQVQMLRASLRTYDRIDDVVETTVLLYLGRQIGAVWPFQLALAEKFGVAPEVFNSAEQSLVFSRNLGMRDKALEALAEGGVVIAVGALHLPGKRGLVALFREAGYTLTAVE
jgi:uncharacterized protein